MTSLFDQFEQASMKTRNNNFTTAEMSSLGYINMTLEQDAPIFSKTKKRLHTLGQNHARRYRKQATGCGDGQQHLVPYESEQPPAT
jgi:hypothetical protein